MYLIGNRSLNFQLFLLRYSKFFTTGVLLYNVFRQQCVEFQFKMQISAILLIDSIPINNLNLPFNLTSYKHFYQQLPITSPNHTGHLNLMHPYKLRHRSIRKSNTYSFHQNNHKNMKQEYTQMRVIHPPVETILTDIKLIFLNPYHYTYVLQKEDNYIYLYDELTMDIVGKSKVSFNENFKMLAFTDNFNGFCTYIEAKPQQNQQAQIITFNLEQDGSIVHHRNPLTKNKAPENLNLFNIAFLQKEKQRQSYLVGLGRNKIYFISLKGEVIKDIDIKKDGRELNLINGFAIKQSKWILIEENTIYFATINYEQYRIDEYIHLENKITSMFLDASIRSQFMAFITELHTVIILAKFQEKWSKCHSFQIPNLNIRKLCFFYPAVNTSTTNKFKDKLFLLIYGDVNYMYDVKKTNLNDIEAQINDNIEKFPIPNDFLSEKMIYIHEYSIEELLQQKKPASSIQPKDMMCVKDIGVIKYTIWANEHAQNCIRVFNEDKTIQSVDLISLLPGEYIGKEWVNLGYRFEPKSSNVLYEQTENNFEKEKVEYKNITDEQLNDWSYSLFPKDVLMRKSIKRLNCINFD